jgi:hypothetical protein
VGSAFGAEVIDGDMQGSSVSVAADREIRFLRAHALVTTCRYASLGYLFSLGWRPFVKVRYVSRGKLIEAGETGSRGV